MSRKHTTNRSRGSDARPGPGRSSARPTTTAAAGARGPLWSSVVVFALAVLPFVPALGGAFLTFDDDVYVTGNPVVRGGLSPAGLAWALRSFTTGNWHPLTWASLMLDAQVHGADPRGFHLTNLLVHGANAVLLFALLARVADSIAFAAAGALLWAVHPLRVESVAWISERKDVLSAFFGLLAVHAWLGSRPRDLLAPGRPLDRTRKPALAATALALAASLACKPMLVTLPVLLLLLDAWPLGRLGSPADLPRRIAEKWPLWLLSLVASALAILAQRGAGAIMRLDHLPFAQRLANASLAPLRYLGLTGLPIDLAAVMPFPARGFGATAGLAGAVALLAATAGTWALRGRFPSLLVGWLWFLVALLPVAGLVQVGVQSIADRYTYVPTMGLALGAVGAIAATALGAPARRVLAGAALVAGAVLSVLAWRQSGRWQDTVTLMEHTLSVTGPNPFARGSLAYALMDRGEDRRALELYAQVLTERPGLAQVHVNMGIMEARSGSLERAVGHYGSALAVAPDSVEAWNDLGAALLQLGDHAGAADALGHATRLDPGQADAWFNLGMAHHARGDLGPALEAYGRAATLAPGDAETRYRIGLALDGLGRPEEARAAWRKALRLQPGHAGAATALAGAGRAGAPAS